MRSKKPITTDEMFTLLRKQDLYSRKNMIHKPLTRGNRQWAIRLSYIDNSLENPFVQVGYHKTIINGSHCIVKHYLYPNFYGSKKKAKRELNRIRKYYKYVKGFDIVDIRVVKYRG